MRTFKLLLVLCILLLPLVYTAPDFSPTYTLLHNWTYDGEDINATTRGGSNNWNLKTTSGVTGNYLSYTGTTTTQYGYIYMENSTYLVSDNDNLIIQGWINHKRTDDHAWPGIMIANSTTAQDTAGVSMHGNNYYHHNWTVRGTSEALNIYSAPNACNGSADTWRYFQINITKGMAHVQTFTDSTLNNVVCNNGVQRVFTKNMSQTYKQGYIGIGSAASAAFDNIEIWKETGVVNQTASLNIITNLVEGGNYTGNGSGYLIVNVSGTVSYTPETGFNCSVYFENNNTMTATAGLNISQVWTVSQNYIGWQTDEKVNITCNNINASSSIVRNIHIDTVNPTLSLVNGESPSAPAFINNSIFYRYLDYFNTSLFGNDYNLFALNFTLQRLNNSGAIDYTIFSLQVLNINDTSYGIGAETGTAWWYDSDYTNARYRYYGMVADSHTTQEIKQYSVKDIEKGKQIEGIKISSDSLLSFKTTKQKDRYSFDMSFNKDNPDVYVECTNPQIVSRTRYKGHIVCLEPDYKWIDFEEHGTYPLLEKVSDNKIKVTLMNVDAKEVKKFNSIGDLNVVTKIWYFNITDGFNMNVSYSDYTTNSGINYTKNLSMLVNYICLANSSMEFRVNNVLNMTLPVTCDSTWKSANYYYRHPTETQFTTSFNFITNTTSNLTGLNNYTGVWVEDFTAPVISDVNFTISAGFVSAAANITYKCTDNLQPTIIYNSSLNNATLFYGIKNNSTLQINSTENIRNGANLLSISCYDGLSTTTNLSIRNAEIRTLYIIDEQKNLPFDVNNISSVKVFLDNNQTSYDFKANNKNNITFIASSDVKLRFELIYAGGTIVLRYVDIGLLENDVRVCANTEGITHYEQILTSSSIRPAILKSVFSDCIVAADYTRFAYQDAKVLKAYTYNNLYYLYTFENDDVTGDQLFLASVDGSIATYINIDQLEFLTTQYQVEIVKGHLGFQKISNTTANIQYYNYDNDNTGLIIAIIRQDTNAVIFNTSSFTNPNNATILFDLTTITGANSTTPFKVIGTEIKSDNSRNKIELFFNMGGIIGNQNAPVIFLICLLMLIFGLSLTATQYTFGWFGILICLVNIGLLSTATYAWYITFFLVVNIIILAFLSLTLWGKHQASIG